ncbi:MAG: APC family permease [Tenuifilaceae bacterium]
MKPIKLISPSRGIAIVISNMIGTGVYTSLGLQAAGINSVLALLFIWITGGIVALCGALTYGELAARIPRSGGEYVFLSELFHPAFGFLSGFISLTIGFAAPLAICAIALGSYASNFLAISPIIIAIGTIVILTILNSSSFRIGTNFNFIATSINVLLIIAFSIFGIFNGPHESFQFTAHSSDIKQIFSPAFAISLVYVSFAYSGWNSAAYITHQIKDPVKNLPKILITGTLIVITLYTLLNFIFLYSVPIPDLAGKIDIAFLAANNIFGETGGKLVAVLISIGLIASINSLLILGPRVSQAISFDYGAIRKFGLENKHGAPVWATLFLALVSLTLIWTSTFEQIMTIIGFTLSIFTIASVSGIFVLRYRLKKNGEDIYHTFGYPFIPIFFILIEGCMMLYVLFQKPTQSLTGIAITLTGFIFYFILIKSKRNVC